MCASVFVRFRCGFWIPDDADLLFSQYYARFCTRRVGILELGTVVAFDRSDAKPFVLAKVSTAWKSQAVSPGQERKCSARWTEAIE